MTTSLQEDSGFVEKIPQSPAPVFCCGEKIVEDCRIPARYCRFRCPCAAIAASTAVATALIVQLQAIFGLYTKPGLC